MGRKTGLFLLFLVCSSFLISFVSADITGTPNSEIGQKAVALIEEAVNTINPLAKYLLGETTATAQFSAGELLFAKILFFIIILSLLYFVVNSISLFNNSSSAVWVISIGVSILSVRFLGNTLVPAILIPYSALGTALIAGLPFVIYFIAVEIGMKGQPRLVRNIAWIFFIVLFLGLWWVRGFELKNQASWIYPATIILAFVMMKLDGTWQHMLNVMEQERVEESRKDSAIKRLRLELADIKRIYDSDIINYQGIYRGGGIGKPHGSIAYNADREFLNRQIVAIR